MLALAVDTAMVGRTSNAPFALAGLGFATQLIFLLLVSLIGLSVDQVGGVNATFSNQQTITVAQLALTKFQNQDGLESVGGNRWRTTVNSGQGQVGTAGQNGFGLTQGGALESSNVDLTIELTNMIIAQRMFESNARVVTSADRVLDTLVNLGR